MRIPCQKCRTKVVVRLGSEAPCPWCGFTVHYTHCPVGALEAIREARKAGSIPDLHLAEFPGVYVRDLTRP